MNLVEAILEQEGVSASDVSKAAGLLGVDMDDDKWATLIEQGSFRAAIDTMLNEAK